MEGSVDGNDRAGRADRSFKPRRECIFVAIPANSVSQPELQATISKLSYPSTFYCSALMPEANADAGFKWVADKLSRKYSIVVAVTIFTIGSILQTASISYAMLVTARLIGGIGIGMLSMVAPLYISEISPPEIRGALLVLEELSIVSGIVVAFWITYGTRYMAGQWSWRLPFLLQLVPGLVLGLGILFLPFS